MHWLQEFIEGSSDPEILEHLRRGLATWRRSGTKACRDAQGRRVRGRPLSVARCFGLPENPEDMRFMERDGYLRQAAAVMGLDPKHPWTRAKALAEAVRRFRGHRWACWATLTAPPPNAGELDRLLFLAMRAGGGKLPTTARRYATILQE